jgi:hypothetical protein
MPRAAKEGAGFRCAKHPKNLNGRGDRATKPDPFFSRSQYLLMLQDLTIVPEVIV